MVATQSLPSIGISMVVGRESTTNGAISGWDEFRIAPVAPKPIEINPGQSIVLADNR